MTDLTMGTNITTTLPPYTRVGAVDRWALPSGDAIIEIYGQFLGFGSSQGDRHATWHPTSGYARSDQKCWACRWSEPRLFSVKTQDPSEPTLGRYLIHYAGVSIVPGEVTLSKHVWAMTGYEVVEIMTTRRTGVAPYLHPTAARVLSQAAAFDDEINEAYINRAVS